MYCKDCGYRLIDTARHQCSECGAHFDPSDSATYYVRKDEKLDNRLGPLVLGLVTTIVGVATLVVVGLLGLLVLVFLLG